jgi:AI-2 transport protein TqsA
MDLKLNSIMKPLGILAAAVIVLAGFKMTSFVLGPVMLAFFFVAILTPFYQFLLRKRVPNGVAVLLTVIFFILILFFLAWVFWLAITQIGILVQEKGSEITGQFTQLETAIGQLPSYSSGLSGLLKSIDPSMISAFLQAFVGAMADFVTHTIFFFLMFVFILTAGPSIMRAMRREFGEKHILTTKTLTLVHSMSRYFVLRTLVNAVTGVGIFVVCLLMGIENALLWGLLTFVLSYIPYIGMFIACVPPGIIELSQGGWTGLAVFALLCIIINGLAEQVVSPLITGKGLSISPVLIFVSFIFWGWILGTVGYLVAVPMTVMVLLFLNSFEETEGFARLVSNIPEPELEPDESQA